ncbi:fimbria/pilus outer membrane usher protein [Pseudomonas sp. GT1P32]
MLILKSLTTLSGAWVTSVVAEDVQFNDAFLPADSRSLDLTVYQKGNPVLSGEYRADVSLNSRLINRQTIRVQSEADGGNPLVCMTVGMLELFGVDINKLSPEATLSLGDTGTCASLARLIPGASAEFSPAEQLLSLSIPQIALRRNARGYVSPELWDRGVTAAMLGYNINANTNKTRTGTSDNFYMGLNGGFNMGDWRLRHNGSLRWDQISGKNYQTLNTFAQRDITALKSQLTLGESSTSGELFDTLNYRGVQLASDDRMLPESMRGYAPVIRGIARTNARVEIRQNGNLLHETTVAPGAFVIDDMYPTGYGGDLIVTVYEADGSQQIITVPYAQTVQLLRPGTSRYSVTGGQTRTDFLDSQAGLLQGTFQYGLSNMFTAMGGVQGSEKYLSVLNGLAFSTPIGAMAVDVTHAQTALDSGTQRGQSLRLSYSRNFLSTGSNFSVAALRFSTDGYLDFGTAMQLLDAEDRRLDLSQFDRARSRLSLSADQSLGDWGQVAISGFTQNYWNRTGSDLQYQLSYSKQIRQVSVGLSAVRSRSVWGGEMDTSLQLTVSMPLEFGSGRNYSQLMTHLGRDSDGNLDQQVTLSGSTGASRQFSYGATVGHAEVSNATTTSLNGNYIGSKVTAGANLSNGPGYNNLGVTLSGSVVAHPAGVTLSPYRGETMAVISAPGAEGAAVVGYPGVSLDGQGNAVVPYLQPYQLNELAIDPKGSSMNVELSETSQQVAPRAGAIVSVKYGTSIGQALLLNVRLKGGEPLPFGASVIDDQGGAVGVVGQGGQLYARVKETTRQLQVRWGNQLDQQCVLTLPVFKDSERQLLQLEALCAGSSAVVRSDSALPEKRS